ncbi:hypothetical protein [Acinetobacter guillouiae]|uniref:hypothetical protein n=1 Tax=Acinetobacter guillouiae TaxID=106649 RepID=UPI00125028D0|nr:hypothetical protein [Acinetobacter guillouiae]
MDCNQLIDKIENFVNKNDISLKNTQEIEVLLESLIIKDELITETILLLASYRPGGGEYMNDESQIIQELKKVLVLLKGESGTRG